MAEAKQGVLHSHSSSVSMIQRVLDIFIIVALLELDCLIEHDPWSIDHLLLALVTIVIFLLLAEGAGCYLSWRDSSIYRECGAVSVVWVIAISVASMIAIQFEQIHPMLISVQLGWFISTLLCLVSSRVLLRRVIGFFRSRGLNSRTAVIVGKTKSGITLSNHINRSPWLGIKLLGFYNKSELETSPSDREEDLILGCLDKLVVDAKSGAIDRVYIALPMADEEIISNLVNELADTTCSVMIIPDIFTFNLLHARSYKLYDVPIISIFDTPMDGMSRWIKRIEDFVLAALILILISPVLSAVALAIKITSPGPIIFKQRRYGIDGKAIEVWKFRSMKVMEDGAKVTQAVKGDTRITPIGSFIRKTSLDELPQFVNVLKGDMSIVGPRPHAVAHNEEYRELIQGYMLRHKVKPGITGLAQIRGWRGETDTLDKMEKRIESDHEYISSWSLPLDLKIIFLTVFKGFVDKNAY